MAEILKEPETKSMKESPYYSGSYLILQGINLQAFAEAVPPRFRKNQGQWTFSSMIKSEKVGQNSIRKALTLPGTDKVILAKFAKKC